MKKRTQGAFNRALATRSRKNISDKPLYLVHVTAVGAGREIISQDILEARYCKHFDKNLVYFFIDRPGYRARNSDEKSDQINRFPFVFVKKMDGIDIPYHAYPFDTGAALTGIFEDKEDPFIPLEDYELENSAEGIKAHISWAFDDDASYFEGMVRREVEEKLAAWQSVEKSFFDISNLASPQHNKPDKRASAIEVCFSKNFGISRSGFHCIIPKQLIEHGKNSNNHLLADMRAKGLDWTTYNWLPNRRPADFMDEISAIVKSVVSDG